MGHETLELQNELFMGLAQTPDHEVTPELLSKLDYLLDTMSSQVALAQQATVQLENRRRVFVAMRNEIEQRLKKKVQH